MNRHEIKSAAKQALKNDRWLPVAVVLLGQTIAASCGILAGPAQYGINEYFTKSLNGEDKKFVDMFAGFKNFGKTFVAWLLMLLYQGLWSLIPFAGPIIAFVKGFSYSQTYLVLRDNPELSANEAITKSREIMDGNKARYFGLILSFLGWGLLDMMFTMGILGILYVNPYMQFAQIKFYEDIK